MFDRGPSFHARLLCSAAVVTMVAAAGSATAQERSRINIEPQPLVSALNAFGVQTGQPVISTPELTGSKTSPGVRDADDPAIALTQLLAGTGLSYRCSGDTYLIVPGPQAGPAPARCIVQAGAGASDAATGTVEALIVTAQKREEDIQDVPIAISAFTQEDLERSQIAGGPDLMTQVPNLTFTKTNFSSYSIQIRGIGTQAISATVDPAVAVAFNNTPVLRNRFFEQEFYDVSRIEVLRGPQGTLYGRNATAGVINLLSARPVHHFEARLSGDVANYNSTRLEGMLNLPLVEDKVAIRVAGAWTKRQGYSTNQLTGEQIDGRDLWSGRITLGFEPTSAISAFLTYEHFEEDDDRLRSGKQLCKKHPTPAQVGGVPVPTGGDADVSIVGYLGQGCEAASLYSEESFQTPNGFVLPYWTALRRAGAPVNGHLDPYVSQTQSRDLRIIESTIEPQYRANTDLLHLQLNFDLTEDLTLTSESFYGADSVFSAQDYNRFTTIPGAFDARPGLVEEGVFDENGFFCDPQLGCSDRLLLGDLSTSESDQFSQEFRLSSDFGGRLNFNFGANFLRHDAVDKYYVFINVLSAFQADWSSGSDVPWVPGVSDGLERLIRSNRPPVAGDPTRVYQIAGANYIDPNPINNLNDLGHNYFLSKNPYRLISYAAFGELYYNIAPDLKLTAGLRYTIDKKHAPEIPSWLLATLSVGHPVAGVVDQEWREPTGRLVLDWKPDLGFTDETLLYASYAHGYKAGGANPPRPVLVTFADWGLNAGVRDAFLTHPKTFEPEFIDSFEIGAKNTLLNGRLTLNTNAFYYDYKGYQISEIVNRAAVNRNFDAEVWGAELEADWHPLENLKFGLKAGWERTRVADGEQVIDLMDRTAGNPNYIVIKPFPSIPSNCIVPTQWLADEIANPNATPFSYSEACSSYYLDPLPGLESVPNGGEGILKDLSGNELPNAPEFTTTLTVDYTLPLLNEWLLTLHADVYRQAEAWTRIINSDPYDRLKPYETVNLAAFFANEDRGWKVMAYVKNLFDTDSITGAFLNSDDSGLTTNVFLTEPRLYGLRVTKTWSGGAGGIPDLSAQLGGDLRVELGASSHRVEARNESIWPVWVDDYPEGFAFPLGAQDEDLDVGDGREIRLSYRPTGSPWNVSAGMRYGRTNGSNRVEVAEQQPGGWFFGPTFFASYPQYAHYAELDQYYDGPYDHATASVYERERHTLIDFAVGRDFGIGGLDESKVEFAVRFAEFRSATNLSLHGIPDAYIHPELVGKYQNVTRTAYIDQLSAGRRFEGAGPHLSWDASKRFLGNEEFGTLAVEWGVTGGMLFGEQETELIGEERRMRLDASHLADNDLPVEDSTTAIDLRRRERVSVSTFGLNLGLAYEVSKVKVRAGYRWEKFYDVLDGGYEESQQHDRTIDGPYLKVSVGFGG